MTEVASYSCWCYAVKKQVRIQGKIVGWRQAELLEVTGCSEELCPEKYSKFCLVGKLREGRWNFE